MDKKYYLLLIGILLIAAAVVAVRVIVGGLRNIGSPTGGRGPNYPFYITTEQTMVKKIAVPKGTVLTYEEQFFKEGQQDQIMNENKLTNIQLPEGATIDWGGVPVYMILKFSNPEMRGYSVYADFNKIKTDNKSKFAELWKSCSNDLGVLVKNSDDWSFNTQNITDISSCSVIYQRYFKEDKEQQNFLDNLYNELKKVTF
ncbi:MAG: hypothetical protein U0V72_07145 [Cytophagales bacterium]